MQDPSLSHATQTPIHNLLGYPGAIFADLAMQLLGLASIMLLLPEMLLGWRLLSHKPVGEKWRGLLWILATFFAAALVSTFPRIGSWPLPTGLGGVFGDALLRAPAFVFGRPLHGVTLLVAALLFGIATAATIALAAGIGRTRPSERRILREADDEADEDEGDRASAWLGMIAHALLSWKARAGRLFRRQQRTPLAAAMQAVSGPRQEPRFDAYGRMAAPAESNLADDEEDEEAPPASRRRAAPRAPARRSANGYVLPSLNLLTAQRVSERTTLSKELIDANAVALESVLGDFGVRGEIINARPGPVVTLYELEPAPGIKSSRVIGLADDIARSMSAVSARVAVVSGRNAIGIELPNPTREKVYLRELLLRQRLQRNRRQAAALLGKDHRRRIRDRRSRAHAASPDRRHHRLRQIGRHQHHDPVAGLSPAPRPVPADHGRSQDARTLRL